MEVSDTSYKNSELYTYAFENNLILDATIELTSKCNWKCIHCYHPEHSEFGLEQETVYDILKQLRKLGVFEISFTGGEVFCRNDIFDILNKARSMGFSVTVFSNISLLNERKIKMLSDMYLSLITCTIFSLNPQIHDSITGIQGSLQSALDNLKLLKKYNIPVEIKTVIMKNNFNEGKEINKYCIENGFEYHASADLIARLDDSEKPLEYMLSQNQLEKEIAFIDECSKISFHKHLPDDYICNSIHCSIALDFQGNILPCLNLRLPVGNIYNNTIEEVWNHSEELIQLKNLKWRDLPKCLNCSTENYCLRCTGRALQEGELTGTSTMDCLYAGIRKKNLINAI